VAAGTNMTDRHRSLRAASGELPWPPAAVVRPLLTWYRRAGRDLPWRRSRDPYRIWLSEVMLQQTQVERVRDYFQRFLERFPTVADLAAATEPDVLRAWEGLGYYRRARQLHAAAGQLVSQHAGVFPQTARKLRQLPGIGRYTAAAIASIAFDQPEPIIEANSRRVLARLAGYDQPLVRPRDEEPLWQLAAAVLPRRAAGRFNQALMDFGAIICTATQPRCPACPLADVCVAKQQQRVNGIPNLPAPRTIRRLQETAIALRHRGRLLVEQRQPGEWWEGLWDFPRQLPAGIETAGRPRRVGEIRYTVTHHQISCRVTSCEVSTRPRAKRHQRWLRPSDLAALAMTAPGRRIAQLIHALSARQGK
jgi:A/G-specific adenine glycosylase